MGGGGGVSRCERGCGGDDGYTVSSSSRLPLRCKSGLQDKCGRLLSPVPPSSSS